MLNCGLTDNVTPPNQKWAVGICAACFRRPHNGRLHCRGVSLAGKQHTVWRLPRVLSRERRDGGGGGGNVGRPCRRSWLRTTTAALYACRISRRCQERRTARSARRLRALGVEGRGQHCRLIPTLSRAHHRRPRKPKGGSGRARWWRKQRRAAERSANGIYACRLMTGRSLCAHLSPMPHLPM
jgi:hypothetical protein